MIRFLWLATAVGHDQQTVLDTTMLFGVEFDAMADRKLGLPEFMSAQSGGYLVVCQVFHILVVCWRTPATFSHLS